MDRGLVTVTGTVSNANLLREAAEHATGANAELLLLSPITAADYEHDLEVLNRIMETESGGTGERDATDMARAVGRQIADDVLSAYDVEYEVLGVTADRQIGRRIVDVAEERECDHVFILSKPRSRFRGAIGQAAKTVLERYDDPVTIGRERDPERRVARVRAADTDDWEISLLDW